MGDKTGIEWTNSTWNFLNGCRKKSPGCKNCYAEALHNMRHKAFLEGKLNIAQYAKPFKELQVLAERLSMPLHWRKPRLIFVNSMSDTFHEDVPFEVIDQALAVMALCPRHTFQVLTKRPDRMAEYFAQERDWANHLGNVALDLFRDEDADCFVTNSINGILGESDGVKRNVGWPLNNLWLGTSVENQEQDHRILSLLSTPAAIHFLSAEPLLGPLQLTDIVSRDYPYSINALTGEERYPGSIRRGVAPKLDWIIVGGESGKDARPFHIEWARSLRDQCEAVGAKFFFKQHGEWAPLEQCHQPSKLLWINKDGRTTTNSDAILTNDGWAMVGWMGKKKTGRVLDGREWNEMPEAAQVAEVAR